MGFITKKDCQQILNITYPHSFFIWLKPTCPNVQAGCRIVAAVIPLKRDAIHELRLALANRSRFVIVLALA
ncbi:MAG: hypothetical protein CVT96_11890, partial [Bacteroidetes bacterium HGW-Bacteroidetes-13]